MTALECTACHAAELKTGERHPIKELHGITLHPFTDLLVHDMGPGLADGRPDFAASGTEWRTQPLWGLGLHGAVNGNDFYLHDGRARSHEEAVLWHDGEARKSRDAFAALKKGEREDLLRFLKSL